MSFNLETPAFSDVSLPVTERAHSFQALLSNFRGKANRSSVPPWPNKLKLGDFGPGSSWLKDLVLGSVALEKDVDNDDMPTDQQLSQGSPKCVQTCCYH